MNTTNQKNVANRLPSRLQTIFTVARKELIDHIRDKRTIIMVFLLSIALGPLILMGLGFFISNMESKAERREIFVQGQEHAPELMNFLQRQDFRVMTPKADFRALVEAGKHDAVLVIPKDFSQKLLQGEAKLELVYDDTRQGSSSMTVRPIRNAVRAFNAELASQRLIARGVAPGVLQSIELTDTNLGSASARAAGLLWIIPWVTLFGCVAGAMAMAIDLVAGERERGSLEPILMNPISRDALVVGKALALSVYSLSIALLTLLGFALMLKYGNLPSIGTVLSLSAAQYAGFIIMVATFAPAMTVLMMALGTYGRNFKEGQTYANYFLQVIAMMPFITLIGDIKDATWQLFVPMMAQLMVVTRLLRGESVDFMHYAIPAAINVAIFVGAVVLITRLLRNEKIIFGRA
ncbi:MAG: ABC transporter permease [Burkholderiales bacterium]|nr:ABC transporter permease subunit [Nitrosomonadaceae bacterium]